MKHEFFTYCSSNLSTRLRANLSRSLLFSHKLSRFAFLKVPNNIRDHSVKVFKLCVEQCEFVIAHRIRRSQQTVTTYSKWWGDIILKSLLGRFRRRKMLFSICAAPFFQWNDKRIPDNELLKLENEIDVVKNLIQTDNDNEEKLNKNRTLIDDGCECNRCKNITDDGWVLFFSNEYLKIWRKEHMDHKGEGLYIYRVYGKFDDVTANDFFQVQVDINYRKEWDKNSLQLYVIDAEDESNSDILYWEFLFPKMFYNRDYVFNRRYKIDNERKTMTVISESTDHPLCPERPPIHRVKEYWSYIVIKAKDDFDQPGLEFTITYFDNPEIVLPTYLATWYTVTGMPDYIMLQKEAAKKLSERRTKKVTNELVTTSLADSVTNFSDSDSRDDSSVDKSKKEETKSEKSESSYSQREKRYLLF